MTHPTFRRINAACHECRRAHGWPQKLVLAVKLGHNFTRNINYGPVAAAGSRRRRADACALHTYCGSVGPCARDNLANCRVTQTAELLSNI